MRTAGHLALAGRLAGEGLPPKASVLPASGGLGRGENILRTVTMEWSAIQRGSRRIWGPSGFCHGRLHPWLFVCAKRGFVWAPEI